MIIKMFMKNLVGAVTSKLKKPTKAATKSVKNIKSTKKPKKKTN